MTDYRNRRAPSQDWLTDEWVAQMLAGALRAMPIGVAAAAAIFGLAVVFGLVRW